MDIFLWICAGILAVVLWGPFLYMMLTPPRRSSYRAASPLELYRAETKQRVARALRREAITRVHDG